MKKQFIQFLSAVLALCLTFGPLMPTASATETEPTTSVAVTEPATETTAAAQLQAEEGSITDYQTFLAKLKVLEGYAEQYAASNLNYNKNQLVLNFLRTGVDRYNDGNWTTLAGEEITGFAAYVRELDAANGTTAMDLKNVEFFTLPNGDQVDFGHMFGTMNISWVNAGSSDLAGWAGDLCDLLLFSHNYGSVPAGTVEEMAAYILANCFGVDADDAFGMDDFYGDMDAYYLIAQLKAGKSMSEAAEAYFVASLSDAQRSAYFMNNRFSGLQTQEDVRNAVYNTYSADLGIQVLEASRELSALTDLRTAACYAFADYLYQQGGHLLEEPVVTEPTTEPTTETTEPATEATTEATEPDGNPYYEVFSSSNSTLAPGITQSINYALTADNKQIVYFIATVDVNREDVTIMANYRDNDPSKGWGMQRVTDQAAAMLKRHTDPSDPANYIENFKVVVATNGDGYNMSTGEPGGLLVMKGVKWHDVDKDGFFAILKDGTAMIGTQAEFAAYEDQIQEAIGGFGAVLVKDGEIVVAPSSDYQSSRASRTAIGITAEGKVVMMVMDGRQEPYSAGGSMIEIAQVMLEAGCVHAINLDGGGSSTYASKPEGGDSLVLVNSPSDGYQRSVSASLVAVSTAKSSNEFEYANISSEYDYLTAGTSIELSAVGVSNTGNAAQIPEGAVWQVTDGSIGSITADGVFTAADYGDATVQLVHDGNVIGEKVLHVVIPDAISVEGDHVKAIFGVPTPIPLQAFYNGNPVAINAYDVLIGTDPENAGVFDGLVFTGNEEVGVREAMAAALLLTNEEVFTVFTITMYKNGEAVFDFNDVTGGDRQLAWNRDVTNSITKDDLLYQIDDPAKSMDISYVFALDMKAIEIPEQLEEITYMLPGADTGATAWDFLLQLAERVSVLTEVRVTVNLDPDLDVDISGMTLHNEYFYLKSAELDENNVLTIIGGWIDQTQAIDPSTANPVCILSGIKATPKADAPWDEADQLNIANEGVVSYRIYLRASSLYSFACIEANQQKFGLLPYSSNEVLYNGGPEKGASFGTTYASFSDSFVLDKTVRNGWENVDSALYYYVDNVTLKNGVYMLPSYEDASVKHIYRFDENGLCEGAVTGLVEVNGGLYYAIAGAPQTGWRAIADSTGKTSYYFFNTATRKAVNGYCKVAGYYYTFEDHKLVKGQLVTTDKGVRYMWAGAWVSQEWVTVDGNTYYFGRDEYAVTGLGYRYSPEGVWTYYCMDENGVWLKNYTGFYDYEGHTYWIENGIVNNYPGIIVVDGYFYYFEYGGHMVKNCAYWPSKTNGYFETTRRYTFDAQGRMVDPPVPVPGTESTEPTVDPSETESSATTAPTTQPTTEATEPSTAPVKNGIYEENGSLYYYENGKRTYAGIIAIDGYFYYVRTSGELAHDCAYWPTKTNGYFTTTRRYTFDSQGRMIDPPVTPPGAAEPTEPSTEATEPTAAVKNGIVEEEGGYWYYVNDVRTFGGLLHIDGSYYYANTDGQLVTNSSYWVSKTNGLLPEGSYSFDYMGRMINPPAGDEEIPEETQPVKNGIYEENGSLYYYVNGKRNYAGLIVIDGYFYYVKTSGEVAHDCQYWPTKTNDYFTTTRRYTFDSQGRMIDPPVTPPGATEPSEPSTEATEAPETTQPTEPEATEPVKNGIVEENGSLYYYVNGKLNYAGLIVIDGYFYYVRTSGELAHDCKYWPTKTNGHFVTTRQYTFDSQGRMVDPPVEPAV